MHRIAQAGVTTQIGVRQIAPDPRRATGPDRRDQAFRPEILVVVGQPQATGQGPARVEVIGGFVAFYLDISAAEARAAICLLRISRQRWPALLEGVQALRQFVAAELNRRKR